ncbi:MAG: hypothetical protein ABSF46_22140 [Terriglobia bacterium]|jgi:hypothetical protein
MGSSNVIGLLFEINADPSKGSAGVERFAKETGQSVGAVQAQIRDYNKAMSSAYDEGINRSKAAAGLMNESLLSNRESVKLLSEEMGIHLPRAVTGAVAEMIPAISSLGPLMLGAFALMEIPKLIGGLKEAAYWMEGFGKEAREAFADVVKASDEAFIHFKTIKEGVSLRKEINQNIAALTVQRDVLDSMGGSMVNYAKATAAMLSGNTTQTIAYIALAQAQQADTAELTRLEEVRFEQLNHEKELEKEANKEKQRTSTEASREAAEAARKAAEEARKALEVEHRWHEEMIKGGQEAGKVAAEIAKHNDEVAASAVRADQAELKFALRLEQFGIVDQKNTRALAQYNEQMYSSVTVTQHLSVSRKALAGITQDLQQIEDAFRKALQGDRQAMDTMAEGAEGAAEAIASMTRSTKAVAYVRGTYDAAKAIECMAAYIESYGTDVPQLLASIQWAAAADQQFSVAGHGSRHGGSGGGGGGYGGAASARANSYGGRGAYGGSSKKQNSGGGGSSGAGPGATVHINNYGPVVTDANSNQQLFDQWSQAVQNSTLSLTASNAMVQGPTATGRG